MLDGLAAVYVSVARPHELSRKSVAAANLFTLAVRACVLCASKAAVAFADVDEEVAC